MAKRRAALAHQPWYLWLLGAYPIVYLYGENLGLVIDREAALCLAAMLAGTTIVYALARRLTRQRHKTALILSLCSLVFSLSGHLYQVVFMPRSLLVWTAALLVLLAVAVVLLHRNCAPAACARLSPSFNLILLILLLWQGASILPRHLSLQQGAHAAASYMPDFGSPRDTPKLLDSATLPDIYYIIPDGYPSDAWLQQAMNFDNSDFTAALQERGFQVIAQAQSNYGATSVSLASTLNLRYYESNPSPLNDLDYLRLQISNSLVARELIQRGYTYAQFMSGYLTPSPIAAINRDFTRQGPIDVAISSADFVTADYRSASSGAMRQIAIDSFYKRSFAELYLDTTLLRLARSAAGRFIPQTGDGALHHKAPARFLAATAEVENIAAMPEATFALVHLLKPHLPVTFNEQGEMLERIDTPNPDEYFADFRYINSRFLDMIDAILEKSADPPVILFQADHGSTYGYNRAARGAEFSWENAAQGSWTHFNIYAAWYLPPAVAVDFPQTLSSVNAFALLLNALFDAEFPLKEDRLFELTSDNRKPFEQREATDDYLHQR